MCTPLPQFLSLWFLHGDFNSRRVQAQLGSCILLFFPRTSATHLKCLPS